MIQAVADALALDRLHHPSRFRQTLFIQAYVALPLESRLEGIVVTLTRVWDNNGEPTDLLKIE